VIENILSMQEGQHFEFKRAGKNERALDTAVAFANAGGGIIFGSPDVFMGVAAAS
jgi:predicted HTH transcriptional regulator